MLPSWLLKCSSCFVSQGLRLNCALLILSLSNNQIGDAGAAHLAAVSIYMKDLNLGDKAFKSVGELFEIILLIALYYVI